MHYKTITYKILISIIFFLISAGQILFAQDKSIFFERKDFTVVRVSTPPKIDGYIEDEAWLNAQPVKDFIMYAPFNGIKPKFNTEVKVVYDDNALYICAMMFDPNPDSIYTELGKRDADRNLNADYFSVQISSFNDGLNGEEFKVSASNVQSDSKKRGDSEEYDDDEGGGNWDAVWESKTRIAGNGWICEMKIPYSALRFSTKNDQIWGINFWREVRRIREQSSWNYVDKETGSPISHLGQMLGMSGVKPPLRLSLTPYLSGYIEKVSDEKGFGTTYNDGMDLKIGLNESYTLDATLIPDFGQVQSDDHILNLTPYETKYNENRSFFTEGTELFSRGDIFYSRRVGGSPRLAKDIYDLAGVNEIVSDNPSEVSLINATKISGRSRRGLGIGVFNAVTNTMYGLIKDTITGDERKVISEPLTNYNMLVFDQSLKNNSFISFANTNVWRAAKKDESFYTANVSNVQSLIQTRNKLYSLSGSASISQKYYSNSKTDFGNLYEVALGKTGGAFRAEYGLQLISDDYDPNDMGYLSRNNEIEQGLSVSYNTFEPSGRFMSTRTELSYENSRLYLPSAFTSEFLSGEVFLLFMNYWSFELRAEYLPRGENDYFEPRTRDFSRFYHRPRALNLETSFDTDMSKRLYLRGYLSFMKKWNDFPQNDFAASVDPVLKVTDRLSLSCEFFLSFEKNDVGYVDETVLDNNIIFGRRDVKTIENTISGSYIFSSQSYLTLRFRHYWSRADYDRNYYLLNDDGSLSNTGYPGTPDNNINYMNIDMVYSWRFAPGSELSVVWKNSIAGSSDEIINNAFRNFDYMLGLSKANSISLKILYYLDYQNMKKFVSSK